MGSGSGTRSDRRRRDDSLGFLVADISRLMRRTFERSLSGGSLTLAQARALVYVSRNEDVRQVDLAALLEVQPMTLARLIDQLEGAGLVERRLDAIDRRAYRIHLTAAAAPVLAAIDRDIVAIRKAAVRGIDREEVVHALSVLRRMRTNLSESL